MSYKLYSLNEIIKHARTNSPYYKELYRDIPENATLEELPLINQSDFWDNCDKHGGKVATFTQHDGQVFKSGGTTGEPKYSLYSAEEWQTMCEYSGAVLAKGGLKNGSKIANLFYAGGMYASFLYTYSMLYFAPAKTIMYNISGNGSIEEMTKTILEHQINCIAGLPSIINQIISYINENNLTGFTVDTIYFAGETLYPDQRERICKTFGREIEFRSVFYASNDGGPIGYFTKDCGYNEHRTLSDLTIIELIDPDTGEVIHEMNRPGAIYITSLFKTLIPLIRYPAGDLGEYTEPEGIPDRKFRLLGRAQTSAKAGYVSISPQDIADVLKIASIDYEAYQIIVTHDIKDKFTFKIAVSDTNNVNTEKFIEILYEQRPLLKDAVDADDVIAPEIIWCSTSELEYNQRTGKLKTIIDKRG
ncbi:MAG: phenylacetate--CoA ligase family protein [Lachnospiraceae bacterium]|nr:phenylacetate--CoA ligase family protein [Lachnospiraceae bacterium]